MRVLLPARTMVTALVVAGVAVGAGCREDPEVAAADERMCAATDGLDDALEAFGDAEEGERAAARDGLLDAMAEMVHASSEVAQAESDAGNNPLNNFNEDLQDTPDDATLSEIAEDMAVAGGDFLEDVKGLMTDRDC